MVKSCTRLDKLMAKTQISCSKSDLQNRSALLFNSGKMATTITSALSAARTCIQAKIMCFWDGFLIIFHFTSGEVIYEQLNGVYWGYLLSESAT